MLKKQVSFQQPEVTKQRHAGAPVPPHHLPEPQPITRRTRSLGLLSRRPPKGSFPSHLDHVPAPPGGSFPISLRSNNAEKRRAQQQHEEKKLAMAKRTVPSTSPSHSARTAQYNKHGSIKMRNSIKKAVSPLSHATANNGATANGPKPTFLFPSETYNNDNKYYVTPPTSDDCTKSLTTGGSAPLSLRHRVQSVFGRRCNRRGVSKPAVHPHDPASVSIRSDSFCCGAMSSSIAITPSSSTLEEDEFPLMLEFMIDNTLKQEDHQYYDELRGVFNSKNGVDLDGYLNSKDIDDDDDDQSDIPSRQSTTGTTVSGTSSPRSGVYRFEI